MQPALIIPLFHTPLLAIGLSESTAFDRVLLFQQKGDARGARDGVTHPTDRIYRNKDPHFLSPSPLLQRQCSQKASTQGKSQIRRDVFQIQRVSIKSRFELQKCMRPQISIQ